MKRSAYFVNSARGALVDEQALLAALRENRIAGAALDVYEVEPLPARHPFRSCENVILSPHMGFVTWEEYHLFLRQAVTAIATYMAWHILESALKRMVRD